MEDISLRIQIVLIFKTSAHQPQIGAHIPSDFKLYKNLRGNRKHEDLKSFKIFLDKAGWNEYINNLGDWLSAKQKKDNTFKNMPDSRFLFTQVFRSADRDEISDLLQKWVAVRMWNRNTQEGRASSVGLDPDEPKPKPLELNVKEYWDAKNQELFETYAALKVRYDQQGGTFPVPDWDERLMEGNQYAQLTNILGDIRSGREKFHDKYSTGLEEDEKAEEVSDTDAGRRSRMQMELETDEEASPLRRKRKKKYKSKRSRPRPAHIPRAAGISGGAPPPQRRGAKGPKREDPERGGPLDPIGERGPPVEAPGPEDDPLMEDAEQEEADMEAYFARAHIPVYRHNNRLRAEVVHRENYEALNGVHLLQTDNNVQPTMGAVHIVHPASYYNDKHFMLDIEGDINEGQKVLVKRSKRGPFKDQSGRSTVMDRSAHVTYRKRAGAFEITIRRGVISSELQQMVSKLNMHRMSIHGSHVVIIKGTKRYRLGPLGDINMKYLLDLVGECVQQYGSCGLEITEAQAGTGALYKGGAYSARFKSNARKGKGVAAAEWERVMGRM